MSFISMEFLLFLAGAILGYYLIPKRFQWVWLLMFSCVFYLCAGLQAVCFLLTTAMTDGIIEYFQSRPVLAAAQNTSVPVSAPQPAPAAQPALPADSSVPVYGRRRSAAV